MHGLNETEAAELAQLESQLSAPTPTLEQLRSATYDIRAANNRAAETVQACRTRLRELDQKLNGANLSHDHAREIASFMRLLNKLADHGALQLRAIPLPNGGELSVTASRAGSHRPATVTVTIYGLDLTKPKEHAA